MRDTIQVPQRGLPVGAWPELSIIPAAAVDGALTLNLSDSVALSDQRSGAAGFVRSQSEAFAINEALNKVLMFSRNYSDAIVVLDKILLSFGKRLSDNISLSDAVLRARIIVRQLSDNLVLNELVSPLIIQLLYQPTSDVMSLGENLFVVIRGIQTGGGGGSRQQYQQRPQWQAENDDAEVWMILNTVWDKIYK